MTVSVTDFDDDLLTSFSFDYVTQNNQSFVSINYVLEDNQNGDAFILFEVADSFGVTDDILVTLNVVAVNDLPILDLIEQKSGTEDVTGEIVITASDIDITTNAQVLSYELDTSMYYSNDSLFNSLSISTSGTGEVATINYSLKSNLNGEAFINVIVSDDAVSAGQDSQEFSLVINPVETTSSSLTL